MDPVMDPLPLLLILSALAALIVGRLCMPTNRTRVQRTRTRGRVRRPADLRL